LIESILKRLELERSSGAVSFFLIASASEGLLDFNPEEQSQLWDCCAPDHELFEYHVDIDSCRHAVCSEFEYHTATEYP
jgi:hypothetical protein